jgi:hypothetical protein
MEQQSDNELSGFDPDRHYGNFRENFGNCREEETGGGDGGCLWLLGCLFFLFFMRWSLLASIFWPVTILVKIIEAIF